MRFPSCSVSAVIVVLSVVSGGRSQTAELRRLPATQIAVDEEILNAFVDEPCLHFERARERFVAMDRRSAAAEIRTATAFLKLESARAVPEGKRILGGAGQIRRFSRDRVQLAPLPTNDGKLAPSILD